MRGYVEAMERLAFNMPEGRNPTDAEVCAAMADRQAYRADKMRPVSEAGYTPGDDMDDLVDANLRQMAGPINQTNEE